MAKISIAHLPGNPEPWWKGRTDGIPFAHRFRVVIYHLKNIYNIQQIFSSKIVVKQRITGFGNYPHLYRYIIPIKRNVKEILNL